MSAIECRELEPLLQPYVDGEFEPNDRVDVDAHLANCEACRHLVAEERLRRARMREAALVAAPPQLRMRIEGALKRERRWSVVRRVARPEIIVAALAACAGFAFVVESQWSVGPMLDETVSRHTRNLPVEVQGDEQHVQRWFAGKVDFNVQLPHLQNVSVAGARLSHVRDRSAAYVVYQGPRAHRVSLFVFDDPAAPLELGLGGHKQRINDRDVIIANERGYNVAMWRDNEIVYSLVSDLDERDIVDLLDGRTVQPAARMGGIEQPSAPVPTPDVQNAALPLNP